MKELHIFIIWHNARKKEKEIINDILHNFDINRIFEINWAKYLFVKNIAKFYGKGFLKAYKKTKQIGNESFLAVALYDKAPKYKNDKNLNILGAKTKYRELTGGGHLVHASDNIEEVNENIISLFGMDMEEFEKKYSGPWNGNIIKVRTSPLKIDGIFAKYFRLPEQNIHFEEISI